MMIELARLVDVPSDFEHLLAQARAEGLGMLDTLENGFSDGSNRFDGNGELLLSARDGSTLVAVGGLNVDPYLFDSATGRVRHLYVMASHRNRGVGGALVGELISEARGRFRRIRVRAHPPEAGAFYEALGFETSYEPDCTHILVL